MDPVQEMRIPLSTERRTFGGTTYRVTTEILTTFTPVSEVRGEQEQVSEAQNVHTHNHFYGRRSTTPPPLPIRPPPSSCGYETPRTVRETKDRVFQAYRRMKSKSPAVSSSFHQSGTQSEVGVPPFRPKMGTKMLGRKESIREEEGNHYASTTLLSLEVETPENLVRQNVSSSVEPSSVDIPLPTRRKGKEKRRSLREAFKFRVSRGDKKDKEVEGPYYDEPWA